LPDVGGCALEQPGIAHAMLEKILLPPNAMLSRQISFPKANCSYQFRGRRKGNQHMKVVRHEEQKPDKPLGLTLAVSN
jgi:hypothetical protein